MTDLYAVINRYGYETVRKSIRENKKTYSVKGANLASALFHIPFPKNDKKIVSLVVISPDSGDIQLNQMSK